MIKDALNEDNFGGVCTRDDDVSHDGNTNMFFDVERTGVERPPVTESVELLPRKDTGEAMAHWKRDKLNNNTSDEDRRI